MIRHIVIARTGEVLGRIDLPYGTVFTVHGTDEVITFNIDNSEFDGTDLDHEYFLFWSLEVYEAVESGSYV